MCVYVSSVWRCVLSQAVVLRYGHSVGIRLALRESLKCLERDASLYCRSGFCNPPGTRPQGNSDAEQLAVHADAVPEAHSRLRLRAKRGDASVLVRK